MKSTIVKWVGSVTLVGLVAFGFLRCSTNVTAPDTGVVNTVVTNVVAEPNDTITVLSPTSGVQYSVACTKLVCHFDGSASVVPNGVLAYSWFFGDGSEAGAEIVNKTYKAPGNYFVKFEVVDSLRHKLIAADTITIGVVSPVDTGTTAPSTALTDTIRFTASCSTKLVCRFDGSSSVIPSGVIAYSWFFGDGTEAGAEIVNKAYKVAGKYFVKFEIVDSLRHKLIASDTVPVGLTSSPPPPVDTTPTDTTPSTTTHAGWYVSPNGASGNAGTATSPWDLVTALAGGNGKVQPGDTVWLRGGTYGRGEGNSNYSATLSGTASAPIIVRQYPGDRASIDGDIFVGGSNTWYWGFELANTNAGTTDVQAINAQCPGCRFINLVVHDHSGDGIGTWDEGPNEVVYGNIVYNNGFKGTSSTQFGHGIYIQNETGTKLVQDNVLFDQFGYGIHIYGSELAFLNNITVDGNVSFNSGVANGMNYTMGGGSPLINLHATNNMAYYSPGDLGNSFRVGYNFGTTNSGGVVTGNYVVGTAFISQWTSNLTFTGNTVVSQSSPDVLLDQDAPTGSNWNNNTYYYTGAFAPFSGLGTGYTLSGWQSKFGYDVNSTMSAGTPPNHIVVEPNAYEQGRANIVVFNWENAGNITVDLSSVLHSGEKYKVVDAQDFYGTPVVSGVYAGAVTIPIRSIAAPVPITGHSVPSTGTQFKTFIVLPVQ